MIVGTMVLENIASLNYDGIDSQQTVILGNTSVCDFIFYS